MGKYFVVFQDPGLGCVEGVHLLGLKEFGPPEDEKIHTFLKRVLRLRFIWGGDLLENKVDLDKAGTLEDKGIAELLHEAIQLLSRVVVGGMEPNRAADPENGPQEIRELVDLGLLKHVTGFLEGFQVVDIGNGLNPTLLNVPVAFEKGNKVGGLDDAHDVPDQANVSTVHLLQELSQVHDYNKENPSVPFPLSVSVGLKEVRLTFVFPEFNFLQRTSPLLLVRQAIESVFDLFVPENYRI